MVTAGYRPGRYRARVGRIYQSIDGGLHEWLVAQHVFFVATAPSGDGGHVNCSPKGLDSFRVLGPTSVAYLDFTGSGVETIAHVRQNGRIVLMFCAFDGAPKIVRLHGRAEVVRPGDDGFDDLLSRFTAGRAGGDGGEGVRAVIRIECTRISDSCGFGVPVYEFVGERDTLPRWGEKKGRDGVLAYQRDKNARSLDDLPGL